MRDEQTFAPSQQAICRTVGEESVILDVDRGQYFGLDAVGTRIWQLLSEGGSNLQIAAKLAQEFDVDEEEARNDVQALLDELLQAELISSQDQLTRNEA